VVFPYTMIPFVVGRRSSLSAVEKALAGNRRIFLATQRNARIDDPRPEDINSIGTIANIVQSLKLPNGNIKLLVEGIARARTIEFEEEPGGCLKTTLKVIEKKPTTREELQRRVSPNRPLPSLKPFLCSLSELHGNRSKLVSKIRIRRTSKSVAIGERNRATATGWVAWARMAWVE